MAVGREEALSCVVVPLLDGCDVRTPSSREHCVPWPDGNWSPLSFNRPISVVFVRTQTEALASSSPSPLHSAKVQCVQLMYVLFE